LELALGLVAHTAKQSVARVKHKARRLTAKDRTDANRQAVRPGIASCLATSASVLSQQVFEKKTPATQLSYATHAAQQSCGEVAGTDGPVAPWL
jgi:hypothetical protein